MFCFFLYDGLIIIIINFVVVVVVQGEVKEAKGGENIEGDWPGSHIAGALTRASFAITIRPLKRTKSTLGTP